MSNRFALQNVRLWWPDWNQAVPFTWYTRYEIKGSHYCFDIDPELAEFADITTGYHMPTSTAKLLYIPTGIIIPFTSFSILSDQRVQVNEYTDGGYRVNFYLLKDLVFVGEAYDPSEDSD